MAMTPEQLRALDRWLQARLEGNTETEPPGGPEEKALAERMLKHATRPQAAFESLPATDPEWVSGLTAGLSDTGGTGSGSRVGPFEIERAIGAGGMGTVYLARRVEGGFEQRVALKILSGAKPGSESFRLFQREREVLSRLEHPGIARLIDGGMTEDWRPWFAMEYVDGLPIDRYADEHRLDVEQRLNLFLQVCEALEYAHGRLVLHRDIKPSNILVSDTGQVKLLDFGLGKIQEDLEEAAGSADTQPGGRWLTPEYASPEQVRGETVSVASEVYQLGLLLYRMLCGTPPYRMVDTSPSPMEMVQVVCETVPGSPSGRWHGAGDDVQTRAAGFGALPKSLSRRLTGDLDNIVLTALAKEVSQRYAGVGDLAADIRRHLDHRPVHARAATRTYRLSKFLRRYRIAVAVVTSFFLVVTVALVMIAAQARELAAERDFATRESERAHAASRRAAAINEFLKDLLTASNPFLSPGETPTVRDLMDQAAERIDTEFRDQPALAAELLGLVGRSYRDMGEAELARRSLEQAMALIERAEPAPDVAGDIRGAYAHTMIASGRMTEARDQARSALDELPEGYPATEAHILGTLATAQAILGDFDLALSTRRGATDLACGHFGETSTQCIGGLLELKYFYGYLDDSQAALEVSERAWELSEAVFEGQTHPLRVMATGAYGDALAINARAAEAVPLLEDAVEMAREIYGEAGFRHARAMDWLANAYIDAGRNLEGVELLERAFDIGNTAIPGNPLTPVWLYTITRNWLLLRRPEDAAAALRERGPELPDQLPQHLADAVDFIRMQVALAAEPHSPEHRAGFAELLDEYAERGSARLNDLRLHAARMALDREDAEVAGGYLDGIEAALDFQPGKEAMYAQIRIAQARRLSLLDQFAEAESRAREALALLTGAGHRQSPLLAEAREALGVTLCRRERRAEGRSELAAARAYWRDHAEAPAAVVELDAVLAACGG